MLQHFLTVLTGIIVHAIFTIKFICEVVFLCKSVEFMNEVELGYIKYVVNIIFFLGLLLFKYCILKNPFSRPIGFCCVI